jgi:transcription elongation factor GreA-like protein
MTLTNASLKNVLFELESLVTNIQNQSIIEDVSLLSIESFRKLPHRHTCIINLYVNPNFLLK